ncbi:hypothetical protein NKK52_29510 [Mesorhizobium sp. C277A]
MGTFSRAARTQHFDDIEHWAIQYEHSRDECRGCKELLQSLFEQKPKESGRNGADDEKPSQLGIGVIGADLVLFEGAENTTDDA